MSSERKLDDSTPPAGVGASATVTAAPRAGLPAVGDHVLGKYRIERVLGTGGMGTVYAAHHGMLDELVAIKVIAPEVASSTDLSARFLMEARATARLRSDHVARIIDVDALDDGLLFIVMELLDGSDLAELLDARGALPIDTSVAWILEALEGLAHAHAAGISHRDIKPSNLFLAAQPDGRSIVKLLDFGVAKSTTTRRGERVATLTGEQRVLGSPGYMSPEQMRDSSKVDARADLFAIGAVLYEMLTGCQAWEGETFNALFAAILETEPLPLRGFRPEIPHALEAIVLRCLKKDPNERFASAAELAAALVPFAPPDFAGYGARIAQLERRRGQRAATPRNGALDSVPGSMQALTPLPSSRTIDRPGNAPPVATLTDLAPSHAPPRNRAAIVALVALTALSIVGVSIGLRHRSNAPATTALSAQAAPSVAASPPGSSDTTVVGLPSAAPRATNAASAPPLATEALDVAPAPATPSATSKLVRTRPSLIKPGSTAPSAKPTAAPAPTAKPSAADATRPRPSVLDSPD
jgi:serine/threonine-protein kinase